MGNRFGIVYHLHRVEKAISLKVVSEQCHISISKLSAFENDKIDVSKREINLFYHAIGIQPTFPENALETIENLVILLYECIAHVSLKQEELVYQNLMKEKKSIQYTDAYITWMLGILLYHVYHVDQTFDYEKIINLLRKYETFFSNHMKQIMYDTFGVYYKNCNEQDLAKEWFDKGIQLPVSDAVLAMIYYHKTQFLKVTGELTESMYCANEAKRLFDLELNQPRSFMCNTELGNIYNVLGKYNKAEKIFLRCLDVIEFFPYLSIMVIYNNLIWNSILAEEYEKALSYAKKASMKSIEYAGSINFYRAFASWKLGKNDDAKEYIRTAKAYISNESKYMNAIINGFHAMLSQTLSFEKKERKLLVAFDEASKKNDLQLQIFVLEILTELTSTVKNQEKELYYKNRLIKLLKQRS